MWAQGSITIPVTDRKSSTTRSSYYFSLTKIQWPRVKYSRNLTRLNEFYSRPRGVPVSLETKVWSTVGFEGKAHSHVTVIHLKHTHTHTNTPQVNDTLWSNVLHFLVEIRHFRSQLHKYSKGNTKWCSAIIAATNAIFDKYILLTCCFIVRDTDSFLSVALVNSDSALYWKVSGVLADY